MEKRVRTFYRLRIMAVILLFSCCLGIAGCGRQEEPEGIQDIWVETEQASFGVDEVDTSHMIEYAYLGSQFWQGEKIQLWGVRRLDGCSVYLHREDGSRELLAEGIPALSLNGEWWIDSEKRCFILNGGKIRRVNSEGEEVFNREIEGYASSICQLEDGGIIVMISLEDQGYMLAELNPDSGTLEEFKDIRLKGAVYLIAAEGNTVLLLEQSGVWEMNLEEGTKNSRISLEGTSYAMKADVVGKEKEAFRLLEDGSAELLWSDGTSEFLKSGQVSEEKEMLTLRIPWPNSWMKEQIVKFNQESANYYITIEEAGGGEWKDFTEKTALDLGTGKGADIISNDAIDDVYSLLEKGAFEDLTPYMEASGIREEDFFPATFSAWKYVDKIYGVNYTAEVQGMCIDKAIAGEEGIADIEDLVNRLLAYDGNAVYWRYMGASGVLRGLLETSESLCGMIDFESGACDFSGEKFEKLLETAKRYGYEESKEEWESLAESRRYISFYCFNDNRYLEQYGKVSTGYLFDDGGHTKMQDSILAVNGNSTNKEGAWEFIRFMLGEKVQSDFYAGEDGRERGTAMGSFPVSRSAFEKLCESHMKEINDGYDSVYYDNGKEVMVTGLTEARKEELQTALENARSVPLRTKPLIQIILEEADSYFSGVKSIDEVRTIVENRVRLFLNERQ